MNNSPTLYINLAILLSGLITYGLLLNLYGYLRIPQKEALSLLLFSCAAFIYIISDTFALFFAFIKPVIGITRFFVIINEISILLFLTVGPYFLDKIIALKPKQKIINRMLFWIGAAATILIGSITLFYNDIFIVCTEQGNPERIVCHTNINPLLILRSIMLTLYLFYMTAQILLSIISKNFFNPVRNILIGLIILCYFAVTYLYNIIFNNNQAFPYPHLALGIILFILFMNFGSVDLFVSYIKKLNTVKNDLNRVLHYDTELGIPNRMGFINDLQSELNKIASTGGNFSLIFVDIDDFQSLNECFGQNIGDEILKMLAKRLTEYFTYVGALYRIGGDEFVLLLKNIKSEEELKNLAGKITASLRNSFSISGVSYTITASMGILQIPNDGKDPDTILNNAYAVIQSSKKIKNTYTVFTTELTDSASMKIHAVNLLRNSINRDEFTLYYQPIVDKNKKVKHVESLLRCTNADTSIGGPGMYIPLLEEAGLINEIDNMVLRKAFHDMEMRIKRRFGLSINLSADQIVNPAYSNFLSSFTRQHGIENQNIILEVTENILIQNILAGRENILKLKEKGFRIAIDDFGKGFSSLTYLVELPVDILKMDIVFVQSVPGDSKKEAMVKYIIEMAHSLNMKIIAEGFEQKEQFDFFKSLGCDFYQGYYFSKPLPIDELLAKYPA
jgi:diguanylate cyclase (GGDEF)-like protein